MKNTIETILSHPIAFLMIVGGTCAGVADIIRAVKNK